MSNKITGKNLHYDQSLPPFLARLKGQHAADTDSPDPILASRRRQAKPRSASQDAEDAPLIVDDDGNVLAHVELAADGTVTTNQEDGAKGAGGDEDSIETGGVKDGGQDAKGVAAGDKVAKIGASKKRKLGKVVGVDAGVEDSKQDKDSLAPQKQDGKGAAAAIGDDKTRAPARTKKKAKKIKLSFGDDDDGD